MLKLIPLLLLGTVLSASAAEPKIYTIPVKTLDGQETTLAPYAGKVLLVVNTASECGFTPQYAGLEALWKKYEAQGVVVLGFPANDFGAQEPGSNAEIKTFCTTRFHVTFPMFEKIHVKGGEQHPLYRLLTTEAANPGPVSWNFNKFLVARDGKVLARFDSETEPDSETLAKAIETALK